MITRCTKLTACAENLAQRAPWLSRTGLGIGRELGNFQNRSSSAWVGLLREKEIRRGSEEASVVGTS